MILQALTNHYETLAKKGLISPEGWAKVGVTFAIKLDKDGNLTDLMVLKHKEERGKKEVDVPTKYVVPAQAKRSSA
ncbi:MAG: type I-C CRISPR-associated protein Cas8c/Csd1, partial [Oscillospiraceae bacterium]